MFSMFYVNFSLPNLSNLQLLYRPQNVIMAAALVQMGLCLNTVGFTNQDDRDKLHEEGLTNLVQLKRFTDKDIRGMAINLAKRSTAATRLLVGMVRLQNLIALMHWVQDCVRTNTDIDPASFNVETMLIAHDRAEFRETFASQTDVMSKAADSGKLKDSNSWEVWSTSFANLLSVIPATSGIPLSYVIREVAEPEDGEVVYNDFMEECVARHPLAGPRFIADRKRVHQLIRTFTQGEGSYQHIASNATKMNGRTDWLALLAFYGGSGNTAKMISKAEAMNRTLHYKKESTMSFEKFADKLKEMFNIFEKHGEPVSEKAKIRQLLDKVTSSDMQITVATIRTRVELEQNIPYETVLALLASQASTTQNRRNVSEMGTHRGGRGGYGGRGRGGRGGRGRGGRGGKAAGWMDDDEFYAMSADERTKYVQERRKKRKVSAVSGKGGNGKGSKEPITKRQIQEIVTDSVATTISAMITVDPNDQEEGPSANAGDSFGGKRNQIQSKIMQLKSSASMAQNKQMIMNSIQAKK